MEKVDADLLLAGLALPLDGQVLIGDRDISRLDETARARMRAEWIGLVFLSGNLIPFLSALGRRADEAAFHQETARRAIHGRAELLGQGRPRQSPAPIALDRQLSGGEAQRVALRWQLASDPELLLADELTGELDSQTASQVMSVLHRSWAERRLTILVVTHRCRLAARSSSPTDLGRRHGQSGAELRLSRPPP